MRWKVRVETRRWSTVLQHHYDRKGAISVIPNSQFQYIKLCKAFYPLVKHS